MLLLDCGNTAIKCCQWSGAAFTNRAVIQWSQSDWSRPLQGYLHENPDEIVIISSVVDQAATAKVTDCIESVVKVKPYLCRVQPEICGMANGYHDYRQLGVDRWMALIAVWEQFSEDAVVVDCGTAITIDVIDKSLGFTGGVILSGFATPWERFKNLFPRLNWSDARQNLPVEIKPGTSTETAVLPVHPVTEVHCLQIINQFKKNLTANAQTVLSGQDARKLQHQLPNSVYQPDLVFEGMLKQYQFAG